MNTATQPAAHWLDILPALPLAKGVPVIAYGLTAVVSDVFADGSGFYRDGEEAAEAPWRVDLDEPQGYAYALRHLISSSRPTDIRFSSTGTATLRHWLGQTTDADRLALAHALASVQA
jgi:hypothetical protein